MQLAVDTLPSHDASFTRNNTPVRRASCRSRDDTAGVRVDAPTWACVHTHPQAENWAESNLQAKGYRTWLPLVAVRRRDRVVRSMWHIVPVPAFSRYVFVQHAKGEPFTPIRYTEGIASLLSMDGFPLHASGEAVEALRAVLAAGGYQAADKPPYPPGTALRWRHGAYDGLDAIAVRSNATRTTVAVVMLGALRHITVPTHILVLRD